MLKRYESWHDFLIQAGKRKTAGSSYPDGDPWMGGERYVDSLRLATTGDESTVAKAEALMSKLDDVSTGAPIREWQPAPFGAYPVIPDFLAGFPDSMRILAPTGDASPIGIYVSISVHQTIEASKVLRRGAAILALVLKLQQFRPTELYLVLESANGFRDHRRDDFIQVIPVDSKPLSVAHACYGLCKIGFMRNLVLGAMRLINHGLNPSEFIPGQYAANLRSSRFPEMMAETLGLTSEDLYVPPMQEDDQLVVSDPVAWVNAQLERYSSLNA